MWRRSASGSTGTCSDLIDAVVEARSEHDKMRAGGLLAGGLAFRMFLWLLPAALMVTGVLGIVDSYSPDSPGKGGALDRPGRRHRERGGGRQLRSRTPPPPSSSATGLVLTIYTGMSLVRALRITAAVAWRLPFVRRPHLLGDGILVSCLIIGLMALGGVESWLRSKSLLGGVLTGVLVALITAGGWLWLSFSRLPHPGVPAPLARYPGTLLVWGGLLALHVASIVYFVPRLDHAPLAVRLPGHRGDADAVAVRDCAPGGGGASFFNATLWYRGHPPAATGEPAQGPSGRQGRHRAGTTPGLRRRPSSFRPESARTPAMLPAQRLLVGAGGELRRRSGCPGSSRPGSSRRSRSWAAPQRMRAQAGREGDEHRVEQVGADDSPCRQREERGQSHAEEDARADRGHAQDEPEDEADRDCEDLVL